MKYYLIPVEGFNKEDAINRLVDLFEIDREEITVLGNDDVSQIFRVPFLQQYTGEALVVTSEVVLEDLQYIDKNPKTFITYNETKNLFLINCEHQLATLAFSPRVVATVDLRKYMKFDIGNAIDWVLDKSLPVTKKKDTVIGSGLEEYVVDDLDEETRKEIILGEDFPE